MNTKAVDLFLKAIIEQFCEYQKEWLTSHNDIEFCPEEETLIVGFLNDTADCYIAEHVS